MSNKVYLILILSFLAFGLSLAVSIAQVVTTGALFPLVLAVVSHLAMVYIIAMAQTESANPGWAHYLRVFKFWTMSFLAAVLFVLGLVFFRI